MLANACTRVVGYMYFNKYTQPLTDGGRPEEGDMDDRVVGCCVCKQELLRPLLDAWSARSTLYMTRIHVDQPPESYSIFLN
jgi:hypothetical protein